MQKYYKIIFSSFLRGKQLLIKGDKENMKLDWIINFKIASGGCESHDTNPTYWLSVWHSDLTSGCEYISDFEYVSYYLQVLHTVDSQFLTCKICNSWQAVYQSKAYLSLKFITAGKGSEHIHFQRVMQHVAFVCNLLLEANLNVYF